MLCLNRGDIVLAKIAEEVKAFEFHGWWNERQRFYSLVNPKNGKTSIVAPHQIICKLTGQVVIYVNHESFGRTFSKLPDKPAEVLRTFG